MLLPEGSAALRDLREIVVLHAFLLGPSDEANAQKSGSLYGTDAFPGAAGPSPRSRPLSTAGTPSAIHRGAGASSR